MTESDGGTFQQLGRDPRAKFGPPGVLLVGFERRDAGRIHELMEQVGAPAHRVACCTTTMGSWTVAQALDGDDGGKLLPAGKVPRVMLLSGLTDPQVEAVLDRFSSLDLPRPIFAVATPDNLRFTVIRLLEDLLAEREEQQPDS